MTADDYKKIMYTMFPPGPLWPHQEGDAPVWDTWISAIAQEAARVDSAAQEMILEAIPDATDYAYPSELLSKWEALAGLDGTGTATERVQALIAQLRRRGNPTLSLFSSAASEIVDPSLAIDGWRLVNSIDLPWNETATANVNYDAVSDPDGGTDADEVELPAASDAIDADILRIADYEAIYVSFKIKLAGGVIDGIGSTLDIELTGRDSASKYYAVVPVDNTWRRYSFTVADVGTGGSDPNLSITLTGGAGVTLHLYDVKAGWREKYFPQLVAGGLCGTPSAPGWEYVWGLEYGDDLTDRDVGGNPDWSITSGAGSITDNNVAEPVSRDVLGDSLSDNAGTTVFKVDCSTIPSTVTQVRISFWVDRLLVSATTLVYWIRFYDRSGGYTTIKSGTDTTDKNWLKVEDYMDLDSGGSTPYIQVSLQAIGGQAVINMAHVRVSAVNDTLESQIASGAPLHTIPVFLSYGELSEAGE